MYRQNGSGREKTNPFSPRLVILCAGDGHFSRLDKQLFLTEKGSDTTGSGTDAAARPRPISCVCPFYLGLFQQRLLRRRAKV